MKEYHNPDQAMRRKIYYLECETQKSDESVSEFGGRIREYARRAKLAELEDKLTRDFFLSGLEDPGIRKNSLMKG